MCVCPHDTHRVFLAVASTSVRASNIASDSASTEIKLTLPCVRLIVGIVLATHRSTVPVVLRLEVTVAECRECSAACFSHRRFKLPDAHTFVYQVSHVTFQASP